LFSNSFLIIEVLNQYSKQCSQNEEVEYICHHSSSSSSLLQSITNRHAINRSFTIHETSSSSTATINEEQRHGLVMISSSNGPRSDSSRDSGLDYRDSGTSSPQPNESGSKLNLTNSNCSGSSLPSSTNTKNTDEDFNDNDSDSNDSVFSTNSSLDEDSNLEVRDIYLGGSCMLRTHWRRDIAIPHLKVTV
jgi:hypothetical protein